MENPFLDYDDNWDYEEAISYDDGIRRLMSLFSRASLMTQLDIHAEVLNTEECHYVYEKLFTYFPLLKSLKVNFEIDYRRLDMRQLRNTFYRDDHIRYQVPHLERLVCDDLGDDLMLSSASLKFLDVSRSSSLESISLMNCPCLEMLVCDKDLVLGGMNLASLAETSANSDRNFIEHCMGSMGYHCCYTIRDVVSIAIIPSDRIIGASFLVAPNCNIIVLYQDEHVLDEKYYKS
jgi:hypothetical protein